MVPEVTEPNVLCFPFIIIVRINSKVVVPGNHEGKIQMSN